MQSILLCGCEAWTLNKTMETKIDSFEKCIYIYIAGQTTEFLDEGRASMIGKIVGGNFQSCGIGDNDGYTDRQFQCNGVGVTRT